MPQLTRARAAGARRRRFYEITKREHVSSRKAMVVVIAASMEGGGRLEGYQGDAAREFLGVGFDVSAWAARRVESLRAVLLLGAFRVLRVWGAWETVAGEWGTGESGCVSGVGGVNRVWEGVLCVFCCDCSSAF